MSKVNHLREVLMLSLLLLTFLSVGQKGEPYKTYDFLCELFDESYASFEEKNIIWEDTCRKYRMELSPEMTDEALFDLFSTMLSPLNDGHVTLKAGKLDKRFSASRTSPTMANLGQQYDAKALGDRIKQMRSETLQRHGFEEVQTLGPTFREKPLFYYTKNDRVGYLAFYRSFSTYIKMVGAGLEKELDQIFDYFKDVDALIVDVRFNIGGEDFFSHAVAARFNEKERLGYYKQTRKNGEFGPLERRMLKAAEKPFLRPTVVLCNDRTVSAADIFMLLMDEFDHVKIVGNPSNGSYSDIYSRKLPNGWRINLSNQRYLTVDKKNLEGIGNPVDLEILNDSTDLKNLHDKVLLKALNLLEP